MLTEIKRAPSLAVETGCKQHKKQRGRHLLGGGRYPMASGSSGVLSLSIAPAIVVAAASTTPIKAMGRWGERRRGDV